MTTDLAGVKLAVGGNEQAEFVSASGGGRMFPDHCLPPRIYRGDGFCRYRTESLRDPLRSDVVGRDQGDKPVDGSTVICPFPDGHGCFGRISVAPMRPYQGPPKLGLTMTSCVSPGRGRPTACIENHEPAWPTTCRLVAAVSIMNGPSPSVLQPPIHSSRMARASSGADTGSLPKPCMTSESVNRP